MRLSDNLDKMKSRGRDAADLEGPPRYTHARLTLAAFRDHGVGTAWADQLTEGPQWYVVRPDGKAADWPLLNSEEEARADVAEFNDLDDDGGARSEAVWQARMAGDMEAF